MSDWQSIGKDPCLVPSSTLNVTAASTLETQGNITEFNSSWSQYDWKTLADECEEVNSTLHQCYWNPNSRVTGKLCKDCYPVCRSTQKSLNFVQFTVGFAIFSVSVPLQGVPLIVVVSDYTPAESQVIMIWIAVIFRIQLHIWGFMSCICTCTGYVANDKHI